MSVAALVLSLIALTIGLNATPAQAASLQEVTGFGSNPRQPADVPLVPDGLPTGRPLVVALHGCTQSAAAYDNKTGWTKWANQWRFALLLPQQKAINNYNFCFNGFQPTDTSRGYGEALSMKQMVDGMEADHGSAASRVYVTGLSAGGAMTSAMAASYPDVFRGRRCSPGSRTTRPDRLPWPDVHEPGGQPQSTAVGRQVTRRLAFLQRPAARHAGVARLG